MADFDEVGFESEEVRMGERKRLRPAFPRDQPVGSSSPSIAVDEEGEFVVVEEEFAVETLDGDGDYVLAGDEV